MKNKKFIRFLRKNIIGYLYVKKFVLCVKNVLIIMYYFMFCDKYGYLMFLYVV